MSHDIKTETGTIYLADIPDHYEPAFCSICANRIGWTDTTLAETFYGICDGCMVEKTQ